MPFKHTKILILGATSGIGLALSKKFLAEGSSVIAVGRRQENLDRLAAEHAAEKDGGRLDTISFDITDFAGIPGFVGEVVGRHADLDCVFMNSGMQRHVNWKEPEGVDLEAMEMEWKVNYLSYMHLTKAFLPFLSKQAPKEVSIIYTTSGLALVPIIYCPNYCASKAALHHMIMMLRLQLKEVDSNVKIVELMPPAVQTELHDDKHQPEMKGRGRSIGMPLDEFVEEAYAGLNTPNKEEVPVQMVKNFTQEGGFEVERQKQMMKMYEMMKNSH